MIAPPLFATKSATRLLGLFVLCLMVGGIAGAITVPEVQGWYRTIVKPGFTPPDRVFGPVWSTLYPMMALAAWLAWRRDLFSWSSWALRLFLLQLGLNFLWSFFFFTFHWLAAASVEAIFLWLSILITTRSFFKRDLWAGLLMVPYLLWVSVAAVLTCTIWSLNA